ncbi:hypothetical protein LEP1GSC050_1809 [Leptospira broomii serovar Hurstbridge str. 5399]|uniref:Uncharacterized protein n=1 Tax=Leptospira broomii serovar Hurstbridge str. 5399 TaxID=1049789 RepID=T0GPS2_9LEPT|nr:hypothetical protein [Leptospira broomii]EQA47328.1 hypothetical protein LEP1GSC050_1809 [Leptospira broomii serovar Hurstbridge str. 5399]
MAEKNQGMIQLTHIGDNEKVEYQKADLIKLCRIGEEYVVSFYQFDYQSLANVMSKKNAPLDANEFEDNLIPLSKIVMNSLTFKQLKTEIDNLNEAMGA